MDTTSRIWKPNGSTLILLDKKFPDTEGGSMRVCGHVHFGPFPKIGDEAQVEGKEGGMHFFRFTEVKPCSDPEAMYFASIQRFRVDYQGETLWQEPVNKPREGLMQRILGLFRLALPSP